MPVFWFAVSRVPHINVGNSVLIFIILHLLVYPASNGYNSFMDRDTTPIGGLEHPLLPTRHLFFTTVVMDVSAVALSLLISSFFATGILFYILASRAYSWRKIRLKKYPVLGYLTVVVFQGAVTFFLVYHGCDINKTLDVPILGCLSATLLIGGFYPLTQIYQHQQDAEDGVNTISYMLGYRGTFIFTGIVYALAFIALGLYFYSELEWKQFVILQICMSPVIVYFFIWAIKVWGNKEEANFKNTMRMNLIGSFFTNAGFITILIIRLLE
ncbi:hypothetical protein BH09BAC2_BH09BAC2_00580 [soil metagenome]